jgi:hypothetical protein
VPRARAFTRSDVEELVEKLQLESSVIEKITKELRSAGVPEPELQRSAPAGDMFIEAAVNAPEKNRKAVPTVVSKVEQAIRTYRLRVHLLPKYQERPAALVAVLKPGRMITSQLLKWLESLDHATGLTLGVPGIEDQLKELWRRIDVRLDYWKNKVHQHRPAGEADAGLALRQSLDSFLATYIINKRQRDKYVANILDAAGVKFPDPKKNKKKFVRGRT